MIHKLDIKKDITTLTYHRNPTKSEIKFGYGAIHHRDFDFEKCFDNNGTLKLKMRVNDDKLIYFCSGIEYFISSKAKLEKYLV